MSTSAHWKCTACVVAMWTFLWSIGECRNVRKSVDIKRNVQICPNVDCSSNLTDQVFIFFHHFLFERVEYLSAVRFPWVLVPFGLRCAVFGKGSNYYCRFSESNLAKAHCQRIFCVSASVTFIPLGSRTVGIEENVKHKFRNQLSHSILSGGVVKQKMSVCLHIVWLGIMVFLERLRILMLYSVEEKGSQSAK